MRQQDRVIIWPSYFDSAKTRKNGRRVPRNLAVSLPQIDELKEAAQRLNLDAEITTGSGYPKTPSAKTGMLLVKKTESKERIIRKIATQLVRLRGANPVISG